MADFLERLRLNNIFGPQPIDDPLFGGLIPRREVFIDIPRFRQPAFTETSIPESLPESLTERVRPERQEKPMNVVYQPSLDELQRLDYSKLGFERDKLEQEKALKGEELALRRESEFGKLDIDRRKLALNQWKAMNPEGQIETDENGKIYVINKRTGEKIDTGLKKDHLSEEDKIRLNIQGRKEVAKVTGEEARKTVAFREQLRPSERISASQQRVAEDDAAAELLRDKYKDLVDEGYVSFDRQSGIVFNRPEVSRWRGIDQGKVDEINKRIEEFVREWKTGVDKRLSRTAIKPTITTESEPNMIAPDGRKLYVPEDQIERMKSLGAKMIDEKVKEPEVSDNIELLYDKSGKIIGARNRK